MSNVLTEAEIEKLRISGRILSEVLQIVAQNTKAGATPLQLDKIAKRQTAKRNAKPAFLGFNGFAHSLCVSINDEIVHGVPDNRKIKDGDIVSLDFGVNYQGIITDSAVTIGVGKISDDAKKLIHATKKALYDAIDMVKLGARVGDISSAIEQTLVKANLAIVKSLTGHGVGHKLHEDPTIPNFGTRGSGPVLKKNMAIAIEPISSISSEELNVKKDGWTCVTKDGSLSAHFEHTILINNDGAEIVT